MNAFEFGAYTREKLAYGAAIPDMSQTSGTAALKAKPPAPSKPNTGPSLLTNMSDNAARVGGGILSTVAGGIGTVGTGVAAGANHAWNAATPKSMNTSPGYTQGVNQVFNKAKNFTTAGAKDVYGGLGGDTNYSTQHAWNELEKGWNDPNVDATTRAVAQGAAWTGHGAWNIAQTVANPGKILANAPRAGINPLTWASQGSRIMPGARGGIQTASTAHRAMPALARAGTAANRVDDFVTTPTEMTNAGTLMYQRVRDHLNQPQQPTQQPQQPQQPQSQYWNDYANYAAAGRMRQSLDPSQPSPYSYSF